MLELQSRLERLTLDWGHLTKRAEVDQDGKLINRVELTGLPAGADIKQIGEKLRDISNNARTEGQYKEIGTLYGFTLLVKTEFSKKEDIDIRVNRFFVMGESTIKYTYNNGLMASDPKLASMNFLNALEKIPGLIKEEQEKVEGLKKDLPVLEEVVNSSWAKEERLSDLKTQLAALEREIHLSLATEEKHEEETQTESESIELVNVPEIPQPKLKSM